MYKHHVRSIFYSPIFSYIIITSKYARTLQRERKNYQTFNRNYYIYIFFYPFLEKIVVISYSLITMASLHAFGTALCQVLVVGVRAKVEGFKQSQRFAL